MTEQSQVRHKSLVEDTGKRVPDAKRKLLSNLGISLISILLALLVAEVVVRTSIETDRDGQQYFMGQPLRPFKPTIVQTRRTIDKYLESSTSYIVYDPYTGWALRPSSQSKNGLYRANSAGIRADVEYSLEPDSGVVRIALFGDSHTHCSKAKIEDSWGYQLERLLRDQGYQVEVINFGVGGYAMDQAYLRWQHLGASYSPDIVIFGFRAENAMRNLNVFRSIYHRSAGVPFSKPRFILDHGELQLVNSPTVPPEEIITTLETLDQSPLAEYDTFYDEFYEERWWLKSKLLAVLAGIIRPGIIEGGDAKRFSESYRMDGEASQVAIAIIEAFETDVRSRGAEFLIVNLPNDNDVANLIDGKEVIYADLLHYLDSTYHVVHPDELAGPSDVDRFGGHYGPGGNAIVARALLPEVVELIENSQSDSSG